MVESRQKPAKLRSNYMVKVIYRSAFARVTEGDTMGRADILRAIKKSEEGAKKIQSDAEKRLQRRSPMPASRQPSRPTQEDKEPTMKLQRCLATHALLRRRKLNP